MFFFAIHIIQLTNEINQKLNPAFPQSERDFKENSTIQKHAIFVINKRILLMFETDTSETRLNPSLF